MWADISEKSARLGAESATGAMEEIFTRHADFTDRSVESLRPVALQAGALFQIDGRVVGFDLFDSALTLRRLLPKLVRSVALDALDRPASDRRIESKLSTKVAEHFLATTSAAAVHEADAVGLGRDLRLVAPKISGAGLKADDSVVHLSAFHL